MTSFEETINKKRGITREKFQEIRDHVYGDGKNIFSFPYGEVASWFVWNRGENGEIARVTPAPYPVLTKGGAYWDGPIEEWDQRIASRLTTDIVFVGLNKSGDGGGTQSPMLFQNARGVKRIVKTFFNTQAEGAYFTDIIKPDARVIEMVNKDQGKMSEAGKVMKVLKAHPGILREHIDLFKEELDFIGAEKPLLIVLGNDADEILRLGLDSGFREERFLKVVKIGHYSPLNADPAYKTKTREKLKDYITIPGDDDKNETTESSGESSGESHGPKYKPGKTGKSPMGDSSLENFDTFIAIVKYYNENFTHKTLKAKKDSDPYRCIIVPGQYNPKFHFEFRYYQRGGIGLELHDETEGAVFEKRLKNLDGRITVNGFSVSYKKSKAKPRLLFKIPYFRGTAFIAGCMDEFIKHYEESVSGTGGQTGGRNNL